MKNSSSIFRQKGFTVVELMVAVLIGLLSMYAVYRVYEGTERTKRNVSSVGEAQVSGLYSIALLERVVQNAGGGMMKADVARQLARCAAGDMGAVASPAALTLRPLPVVVNPSSHPDFDDIFVFSGNSSFHPDPLEVSASLQGAATIAITPFGFKQGDVLVDTTITGCRAYRVPSTIPVDNIDAGMTTSALLGVGVPEVGSNLIDFGTPQRVRFYVDPANNTLLMESWVLGNNSTWTLDRTEPVISGVMSFRVQYGIGAIVVGATDIRGNTLIDPVNQWVWATAPTWDMENLLRAEPFDLDTIRRIKAIRLSIIVRADEPDRELMNNPAPVFTQFADCPVLTTCPSDTPSPTLQAGWRYRMYETVIPLRNVILN